MPDDSLHTFQSFSSGFFILWLSAIWMLWPAPVHADTAGFFPARQVGWRMDSQIREKFEMQGIGPEEAFMVVTTASNLHDLRLSSPLARYASEELSQWFVQHGYRVREIRRAADISMVPETGEIVLTRQEQSLWKDAASVSLILAGTYSVLTDKVVFHFRVLQAAGNEVLAAARAEVPMTGEVFGLLTPEERAAAGVVRPTVKTRAD